LGYQYQSISQYLRIEPKWISCFPSAGWWKEREGREGKMHSLLHPSRKAPEWNSLCQMVESESEEKDRSKVAL
jgi:hypothetical protein